MPEICLNVLSIHPTESSQVFEISVDDALPTSKLKSAIENHLRWPESTHLWMAPPGIYCELGVVRKQHASSYPRDTPLDDVPRKWITKARARSEEELHFIAISLEPFIFRLYNMQTGTITSCEARLNAQDPIRLFVGDASDTKVYKLPPEYRSQDADLSTLDLTKLTEVRMGDLLCDHYPWGPLSHEVQFVIAPPPKQHSSEDGDVLGDLPSLRDERMEFFESHPMKPPSSETVEGSCEAMETGRPLDTTVPASLFDKILFELHHDLSSATPSDTDWEVFYELRRVMKGIFTKELFRRNAFHTILQQVLPDLPRPGRIGPYETDGDMCVPMSGARFIYWIDEIKNELVKIHTEPHVQAARCYLEHCRECTLKGMDLVHFNFPAILICQIGTLMIISVAVLTSKPFVQQLATVSLNAHNTDIQQMEAGARAIAALRIAAASLSAQYPSLLEDRSRQPKYPFPRSFILDGTIVNFTYVKALYPQKRLYRADCEYEGSPRKVIVKYTLRYSRQAHVRAVALGFAPRLLDVQEFYQWYMVVMEDVSADYTPLYAWQGKTEELEEPVREVVDKLHNDGFVHGDVRDVNILVRNAASDGQPRILLVDWDWAGREGEVRYPRNISPDIPRHQDAVAGAIIKRSHDVKMVDDLFPKTHPQDS
ncbi:hypothetical protein GLOTRDRAFT_128693 [Gloeophyllum trabeum ATCC 11539]|uniref:Uncharacterized protein n=1 Tax=Gloeophyllum trabeum (strain ATCC 11539 / FP-39264 / Madison 617) TaxID=670483 RepID=S7QA25_GLOTA|nr:uncharacterized protein GLOTRDRAFT_128693 [Gloeophyllum trabeum ATCC 11539]EPQ56756.1 hypothetical protein GLOTRDRAFT_128693 [Gloeophyllum trabeum ATCC 11539]